jgi:hypothetical protein
LSSPFSGKVITEQFALFNTNVHSLGVVCLVAG